MLRHHVCTRIVIIFDLMHAKYYTTNTKKKKGGNTGDQKATSVGKMAMHKQNNSATNNKMHAAVAASWIFSSVFVCPGIAYWLVGQQLAGQGSSTDLENCKLQHGFVCIRASFVHSWNWEPEDLDHSKESKKEWSHTVYYFPYLEYNFPCLQSGAMVHAHNFLGVCTTACVK